MPMNVPYSRPCKKVAVDATPTTIAVFEPETNTAMAWPSRHHQAHNELYALLKASSLFGRHTVYWTDSAAKFVSL